MLTRYRSIIESNRLLFGLRLTSSRCALLWLHKSDGIDTSLVPFARLSSHLSPCDHTRQRGSGDQRWNCPTRATGHSGTIYDTTICRLPAVYIPLERWDKCDKLADQSDAFLGAVSANEAIPMKLSPDISCVTSFIVTSKRAAATVASAPTWGQARSAGYLPESICTSTSTACVFFA
jgi:hypothetical protein